MFIVLPGGSKIVIPIGMTSTVSQLQAEALRRARVMGFPFEQESFVLLLGSRTGAIAFEEDLIEDVLDLAAEHTFWLSSIEDSMQAATLVSFPGVDNDCFFY